MSPESLHQPSLLQPLHACLPGSISPRALHIRGGVIGQPCFWAGLVLKSLSIPSGTQHAGAVGSGTGKSSRYSGTLERKGSLRDQAVSNLLIGYSQLRVSLVSLGHLQRPLPVLRRAAHGAHPLPVGQREPAPGRPHHLHHRRQPEGHQPGRAAGR